MAMPDAAWRSLLETHLANLRSHRAVLDHLVGLYDGDAAAGQELEGMRRRAERIWEDAVRAGELLVRIFFRWGGDGLSVPETRLVYSAT